MVNACDLNLRHLRLLIAIDESSNVSAVARAASISQPALTQALAGLDEPSGQSCFIAAGVVATADGERIILRVRRALNHLAQACRDLGKIPTGVPLVSYLTMAHVRSLTALAESGGFSKRHPRTLSGQGHRTDCGRVSRREKIAWRRTDAIG